MGKMYGGNMKTVDITFFNSDMDSENQTQGPNLSYFSQVQMVDIERQHSEVIGINSPEQNQATITPHPSL